MRQIDATELRRSLFVTLKDIDGPVEIKRHGRVVAVLLPPSASPKAKAARAKRPAINRRRIARFCRRHHIKEFSLFGSILRNDFNAQSDVDVLIDKKPEAQRTLAEYTAMREELSDIFGGRKIDLLDKAIVAQGTNQFRKQEILETAKVIHVEK